MVLQLQWLYMYKNRCLERGVRTCEGAHGVSTTVAVYVKIWYNVHVDVCPGDCFAKVHYSKPHLAMFEHMRVPSENNVSSTCLFYLIFIYELNSNQPKVYTHTACLFLTYYSDFLCMIDALHAGWSDTPAQRLLQWPQGSGTVVARQRGKY